MGILKEKSNKNTEAANILQATHCCSSVHCSYYSCVQLAKHILVDKLSMQDEVEKNHKSFHKFFIDTIYQNLIKRRIALPALEFQSNIIELKILREDADYQDIIIEPQISLLAIKRAKKVKEILNRNF